MSEREQETRPLRERGAAHRCLCVLVSERPGYVIRNWCWAATENPDSPFCRECLLEGHDERLRASGWTPASLMEQRRKDDEGEG